MAKPARNLPALLALAGISALVVVGVWQNAENASDLKPYVAYPPAIMGTETQLIAVAPAASPDVGTGLLEAAEAMLRDTQVKTDYRIDGGDLHRLNHAPPTVPVEMSPETLTVLRRAEDLHVETHGAFDVTLGPIIRLWIKAAKTDTPPTPEQILQARQRSNWDLLQLSPDGAMRLGDGVEVDLGGIAKGYGIDRAVEALQRATAVGGLINVGGDIRCFGKTHEGGLWTIHIRDPFAAELAAQAELPQAPAGDEDPPTKPLASLRLTDRAVCTSGHYERYSDIAGRRYSHIIDPRPGPTMGYPLDPAAAPVSVTVVAPEAVTADAWATALSVLGPAGLDLIPAASGIDAMLVTGTPEDYRCTWTPGMEAYFLRRPAEPGRPADNDTLAMTRER